MNTLPPKADKQDKILEIHGDTRVDPYYWLNRENLMLYLVEKKIFKSVLKSTEKFQKNYLMK